MAHFCHVHGTCMVRAWHVQVRSDAFNIHLAGQEDAPLLAGELFGRLLPDKCSWRLNPPRDGGTEEQAAERLALPFPHDTQPPLQPPPPPTPIPGRPGGSGDHVVQGGACDLAGSNQNLVHVVPLNTLPRVCLAQPAASVTREFTQCG